MVIKIKAPGKNERLCVWKPDKTDKEPDFPLNKAVVSELDSPSWEVSDETARPEDACFHLNSIHLYMHIVLSTHMYTLAHSLKD